MEHVEKALLLWTFNELRRQYQEENSLAHLVVQESQLNGRPKDKRALKFFFSESKFSGESLFASTCSEFLRVE